MDAEALRHHLDHALWCRNVLFLSGWILESHADVTGWTISHDAGEEDATRFVARFARPDVVEALGASHDSCGFLLALPMEAAPSAASLRLILADGHRLQVALPPLQGEAELKHALAGHEDSVATIIQRAGPGPGQQIAAALGQPSPFAGSGSRRGIDLACVLPSGRVLVVGWTEASDAAVTLRHGEAEAAPGSEPGWTVRPDPDHPGRTVRGFALASATPTHTRGLQLVFDVPGARLRHPLDKHLAADAAALLEGPRNLLPELYLLALETVAAGENADWLRPAWRDAAASLPDALNLDRGKARLCIDVAVPVGTSGVFLAGWSNLGHAAPGPVTWHAPGTPGREIAGQWMRHPRPDVWKALQRDGTTPDGDAIGFVCFARAPLAPGETISTLAVRDATGLTRRMRVTVAPARGDALDSIRPILTSFWQGHRHLRALLDGHVGPAVREIWRDRAPAPHAPEIIDHGAPPEAPECSIVVPIYGRWDFIEHQLVAFADDPAMRRQELIYVIDDPQIYDDVRVACQDLARLYRHPFRLVYAGRNGGFAQASNLGASLARAPFLLLLNSDVLPVQPGWLPRLIAAAEALPEAGAVAPLLTYEDGSIQHAGMRFARLPIWGGMWINEHPAKGQPALGESEAPRMCQAVTGACLLIRRALFAEIGGLSEDYVIGDFEDSDLCLKLTARGLSSWLVPSVRLVHLERQSQNLVGSTDWRTNLSLVNCWTHTTRWDGAISRLAGETPCAS